MPKSSIFSQFFLSSFKSPIAGVYGEIRVNRAVINARFTLSMLLNIRFFLQFVKMRLGFGSRPSLVSWSEVETNVERRILGMILDQNC